MTIGFIGDTILSDDLSVSKEVVDFLCACDFNVANLESPFINRMHSPIFHSGMHQLTNNCEWLKRLNIQAVSLANNHMLDFGFDALKYTIDILETNGIRYFGAGINEELSLKPVTFNKDDIHVAISGYMQHYYKKYHFSEKQKPGVAKLNLENISKSFEGYNEYKKIIFNHWNTEHEFFPDPVNFNITKTILKNIDAIIGSHSHCIQTIQKAEGNYCFHGLGNFLMPHTLYSNTYLGKYPKESYFGVIVVLNFNRYNYDFKLKPYKIKTNGNSVQFLTKNEEYAVINNINERSNILNNSTKYIRDFKKLRTRKLFPILTDNERKNANRFKQYLFLQFIIGKLIGILKKLDKIGIKLNPILFKLKKIS